VLAREKDHQQLREVPEELQTKYHFKNLKRA